MDRCAFLFDLDGVIFDTEGQYSVLWNALGQKYFSDSDFAWKIKGQTLSRIFSAYFPDDEAARKDVRAALARFEREMDYSYVPGAREFIEELRSRKFYSAIVTSSDRSKMENVYMAHPEIKGMFSRIFTGEDFPRSKPYPDCYLLGMKTAGAAPEDTFIFEDSFNGLQAAKDSGGNVIALATTNPREKVAPYASLVADDFTAISLDALLQMSR